LHLNGENGLLKKDEIISDSPPHVTLPNAVDFVDELQIFDVPSPLSNPAISTSYSFRLSCRHQQTSFPISIQVTSSLTSR
jgi:hypothetical protein